MGQGDGRARWAPWLTHPPLPVTERPEQRRRQKQQQRRQQGKRERPPSHPAVEPSSRQVVQATQAVQAPPVPSTQRRHGGHGERVGRVGRWAAAAASAMQPFAWRHLGPCAVRVRLLLRSLRHDPGSSLFQAQHDPTAREPAQSSESRHVLVALTARPAAAGHSRPLCPTARGTLTTKRAPGPPCPLDPLAVRTRGSEAVHPRESSSSRSRREPEEGKGGSGVPQPTLPTGLRRDGMEGPGMAWHGTGRAAGDRTRLAHGRLTAGSRLAHGLLTAWGER